MPKNNRFGDTIDYLTGVAAPFGMQGMVVGGAIAALGWAGPIPPGTDAAMHMGRFGTNEERKKRRALTLLQEK